ncbi:MAG: hypothetical protein QG553_612 [Patescibacteria group bacterium]|nr:hypothetical protein [Patescibacteria group bacterium]
MKKAFYLLVAVLLFCALFQQLSPVTEVRYNTYNKSVDCYNEGNYMLPEGCVASIKPTVAQTLTGYGVYLSSLGIIGIGIFTLVQSTSRKK